jgi:hypothetical protein
MRHVSYRLLLEPWITDLPFATQLFAAALFSVRRNRNNDEPNQPERAIGLVENAVRSCVNMTDICVKMLHICLPVSRSRSRPVAADQNETHRQPG